MALALAPACAPAPSTTPLGMGPLAIAERDARSGGGSTPTAAVAAEPRTARGSAPEDEDEHEESPGGDEEAAEAEPSPEGGTGETDDAKAGAGSPVFEGLYAGSDVAIFRLPGFPDREQLDDKAKIRIERDSQTRLLLALVNSENGTDLCVLAASIEGSSALLEAGQPCFGSENEGAVQAELSSGKAVLAGDRLTFDAEGSLFVRVGEQELEGELSYSFEGRRQ